MIPFKVQFDKLTTAYIEDRVNPYHPCACFIGNLLNSTGAWSNVREYYVRGQSIKTSYAEGLNYGMCSIAEQSEETYTVDNIISLENLFLKTLEKETIGIGIEQDHICYTSGLVRAHLNYEEALFKAFSVTLDTLREIHESFGEKVDDFTFTKRELQLS
jgi:hypothetical protein